MALPVPNLSLQSASQAHGGATGGIDNSGFVVNFGGSNSTGGLGGALPQWLPMVALAAAAVWLIKRARG